MRRKSEHAQKIDCSECIAPRAAKLGAELLDIEMWCWGRDIIRKSGNTLLEYGFTRGRPPEGIMGSSRYSLDLGRGSRIVLWGWGVVHHTDAEGVFLRRYKFDPKLTASRDELLARWSPEYIPGLRDPGSFEECRLTKRLLINLIQWIGEYERWIQDRLGVEYRRDCVKARRKPTRIKAEQLPSLWEKLARYCSGNNCWIGKCERI